MYAFKSVFDPFQVSRYPIEFCIIYFKIRYWYYFFGNTQVRCCKYGHSLLDKRPYLVTGLTRREVRTDCIHGGQTPVAIRGLV